MNRFIDEKAKIGKNVHIGNFTEIFGEVIIEDNVYISSFVSIGSPAEHKNYAIDEKLKTVVVKKNSIIREHVTINSGIFNDTLINSDCYIMNKSHIGHDAVLGKSVTISPSVNVGGHTQIKDYSNIGMNSTTHQNTIIEEGVMLGANSFGKGLLKKGLVYVGSPARPIKLNQIGLEKLNLSKKEIQLIIDEAKKASPSFIN